MAKQLRSNLDAVREHLQKTGGGSDNRWFNIKAPSRGEKASVQIRVLPPWSKRAKGFFYYTVAQHYGFTVGGRGRALDCPESVEGKGYKCPVCVFIARLKNSGEVDHDKLQKRLFANRRYFVNVIDRAEPDAIKIYGSNKKFIEAILDASDDPDVGDITNAKTGRDITIVRTGAGLKTRYSYRVRLKSSPVVFDPANLYQLDKDVSNWMSYDEMARIIQDNYPEELKEIGLKFKLKESKKVNKKKVEDEEDESTSEDDDIEDEDTEDEEENEEDIEEGEDEESDEEDEESEEYEDEDDEEED